MEQSELLKNSMEALKRAGEICIRNFQEEIVAVELRNAASGLGAIIGQDIDEELLDRIFSRFCIGK
jgi:tRNA modification GTPase